MLIGQTHFQTPSISFGAVPRSKARRLVDEHLTSLRAQLLRDKEFDSYILYPRVFSIQLQEKDKHLSAIDLDNRLVKMVSAAAKELGFRLATRAEAQALRWEDAGRRNDASQRMKSLWDDPTFREYERERRVQQWKDPSYRKQMQEAVAARNRQMWQDPIKAKAMGERIRERLSDPTVRCRMSEHKKKNWADPDYRAHMQKTIRQLWQDGQYRNRVLNGIYDSLGSRRNWVRSVERLGEREPLDRRYEPADMLIKAEELKRLNDALSDLEKYAPDAYDLIISVYGYSPGMENDMASLKLLPDEQLDELQMGLTFLRQRLVERPNLAD